MCVCVQQVPFCSYEKCACTGALLFVWVLDNVDVIVIELAGLSIWRTKIS